jgi:LmbE family N-acetylglucosaminyl deacetylase
MTSALELTNQSRVLVFAPHPDDESLGTGGLLQLAAAAGASRRVVFVTDGDNNPWMQRIAEKRWRIGVQERVRWGELRRREALAALASLGIAGDDAIFLGYPDQGITKLLLSESEELLSKIAGLITEWRPTLLVAPSAFDLHPDHSAIAVLIHFARLRLNADQPPFMTMSYLLHSRRSEPPLEDLITLPLPPQQQRVKRQAILCHATQLQVARQRLLKHLSDSETFIPDKPYEACGGRHPIHRAVQVKTNLRLEISSRARPGAFGQRSLYIVSSAGKGQCICRYAALPEKTAQMEVYSIPSGGLVSQGRYLGNRRYGKVLLPASDLPLSEKVFAKLERRFGFFDEAGWCEVPPLRGNESAVEHPGALPDGSSPKTDSPVTICCVIPCYNVEAHCGEIVREAALYVDQVIAVDDGSIDDTSEVLRRAARENAGRVRVISLPKNRGKGVALIKGFRYALEKLSFDVLVTMDGDRQHLPADIPRLVRALNEEKAEMAIGERSRERSKVPLRSRLGNHVATWVMRRFYPYGPNDTQSGLRAFTRGFVEQIVRRIRGGRYETEAYILMMALEMRKHIATVPIESIYLDKNSSSHFRPLADGLRIYRAHRSFRKLVAKKGLMESDELIVDAE